MSNVKIGLSQKDECFRLAVAAHLSEEEAEKACSTCSDSEPLYDVAVKENSKVGTIPLGTRTNPYDDPQEVAKLFIEDRVKLGDSVEEAKQKSIGIKRFCYDDASGFHMYYCHNANGAIEYDRFNAPAKPVETADEKILRKVLDLRRTFGDSEEQAFIHASEITNKQPITETARELQTPIASNLLAAIANGADDLKLINIMANWQISHENVELQQLNAKQKHDHDYSHTRLTVGNLYARSSAQVAADQYPNTLKEFEKDQESKGVHIIRNTRKFSPISRTTVGSLFGKTKQQIIDESQTEDSEK